jgi:hypothetical protein
LILTTLELDERKRFLAIAIHITKQSGQEAAPNAYLKKCFSETSAPLVAFGY